MRKDDRTRKTWINPKLKLKKSNTQGKGLFALERIKKGETVVIFGGQYVSSEEAQIAKKHGKAVMQWDEDLYTVSDSDVGLAYYVNHSCDPNTWMIDAFTLSAMTNIKPNTEISVDYSLFLDDENYISDWKCKCESNKCRKRITGKDWKLKELQKRYKDHFSPLISKKIKGK